MFKSHIDVCKRLRFNSLCCVNNEQSSFTGSKCAADFVGKVYMTGGVYQIENIFIAVFGTIGHMNSFAFDGDTTFPLQLHTVKDLLNHLPLFKDTCLFQNSVGQGAFAMVNMCNDTEIPDVLHIIGHEGLQVYFTLLPSLFSVP